MATVESEISFMLLIDHIRNKELVLLHPRFLVQQQSRCTETQDYSGRQLEDIIHIMYM
jgi:hypothetical protein